MAGVTDEEGNEVHNNIHLRFIHSFRFMASSLDKLGNLCGTRGIHCYKYKGNMELINISDDYIALLWCARCRIKNTKDLDEGVLNFFFNHASRFLRCDEKFRLMVRTGVYPYEYMDGWEKFTTERCVLQQA